MPSMKKVHRESFLPLSQGHPMKMIRSKCTHKEEFIYRVHSFLEFTSASCSDDLYLNGIKR